MHPPTGFGGIEGPSQPVRSYLGGDTRIPDLSIRPSDHIYLADTDGIADVLRASQKMQLAAGTATQLMTADQIKTTYQAVGKPEIMNRDQGSQFTRAS